MRARFTAFVLLIVVASCIGAVAFAASSVIGAPTVFPVTDWAETATARVFNPETLYEEINGEAEGFLPYDFRDLTVQIVAPKARVGDEIRIERFRFATGLDAWGIFSRHRHPEQETATIGSATAIVSDQSLDFQKGTSFVRIRATGKGVKRDDLFAAAKAMEKGMPGGSEPPVEASCLASVGADPATVVYQRQAVLGIEALAPGFEGKKTVDGIEMILFIIEPRDGKGKTRSAMETLALPGESPAGDGVIRVDLPRRTGWTHAAGKRLVGVAGKGLSKEAALPLLDDLAGKAAVLPYE